VQSFSIILWWKPFGTMN